MNAQQIIDESQELKWELDELKQKFYPNLFNRQSRCGGVKDLPIKKDFAREESSSFSSPNHTNTFGFKIKFEKPKYAEELIDDLLEKAGDLK